MFRRRLLLATILVPTMLKESLFRLGIPLEAIRPRRLASTMTATTEGRLLLRTDMGLTPRRPL